MAGGAGEGAGCVLAVAGRRIDPAGAASARFPLSFAGRVSADLHRLLIATRAVAVVASAANGADLLALQAAGDLGLRRVVVLPCQAPAFKASSVTDRAGNWGPLFDTIINDIRASGSLIEHDLGQGAAAYAQVTDELIARAGEMANFDGMRTAAVAVWESASRGPEDMTAYFRRLALERGFDLHEVRTLP